MDFLYNKSFCLLLISMRPAGSQSYEINKLRVDYIETFQIFYDFSRLVDAAAATYYLYISAQWICIAGIENWIVD